MAFLTRRFKIFSVKLERNFNKYMNYSTLQKNIYIYKNRQISV